MIRCLLCSKLKNFTGKFYRSDVLLLCLFLILYLLSPAVSNAQVFDGDLYLTKQAQIDTFAYTAVTGHLCVNEKIPGSITNLDGLSKLTSVGSLNVVVNIHLPNIDGLSNLKECNGNLIIQKNDWLSNVDGLSGLKTAKTLLISENAVLQNINGLSGFITLSGNLQLDLNPSLENLDSLIHLTSVAGYFYLQSDNSLQNVDGLSNLHYIGGEVSIYGNNKLANINGLLGLDSLGRGIEVILNPSIKNVDGLSKLKTVPFNLYIEACDSLTNIDGLSGISQIGYGDVTAELLIGSNKRLKNIDGLSGLQDAYHGLALDDNPLITNVNGLSNLKVCRTILFLSSNKSLTEFCGLYPFLTSGNLKPGNPIVSIGGNAANPTRQQIINAGPCPAGNILAGNLKLLTQSEIDNFNYTSVTGILTIEEYIRGDIKNLNGLSKLESAKKLRIINNYALSDIRGLSNLKLLEEGLEIENNHALAEYCGFHPLLSNGYKGSVNIANNEINPTVDEILNAGDCAAVTDVKNLQAVPLEYGLAQNYPNPFNPATIIKYSIPKAGFVRLNIYNALGQKVKTLVNENKEAGIYEVEFNGESRLASGIYVYRLEAGSYVSTHKMIMLK